MDESAGILENFWVMLLEPDNEQQAAGGLADLLPQVVDKLTPNGQLPQGNDLMAQGLELLKGKLFG